MNRVIINGKTYEGGRSIQVFGDTVIIDGKAVSDDSLKSSYLKIEVEGVIENLSTHASVVCQNVTGNVDAGGSVKCGDVGGSIDAGGSVQCGQVFGDIDAGGSVQHR